MALSSDFFIHESDKAALDALKAIPGFTGVTRAFMKVWNEKQFRILNLSSRLRVSEQQLPGYYARLAPICRKLGIEKIPELYIEQNPYPNAYTYGDNDPFIVLTSGMIDTVPEELISTVLAHECGHIACHHTLYTTMGSLILSGTSMIPGFGGLITMPMQMAFAYWMRCSEFSADRAAMICENSSERMVETCMYLAGYNQNIKEPASRDLFIQQAEEYQRFIEEDALNKTMEAMILAAQRHPLTAVRAYEADRWGKSEAFARIVGYLNEEYTGQMHRYLPIDFNVDELIGRDENAVVQCFKDHGFTRVRAQASGSSAAKRIGEVLGITADGNANIHQYAWLAADADIAVYYCAPEGETQVRSIPGRIRIQESSGYYSGKDVSLAYRDFTEHGFTDVVIVKDDSSRPFLSRDGQVFRVTVRGNGTFAKGDWADRDAPVEIYYY